MGLTDLLRAFRLKRETDDLVAAGEARATADLRYAGWLASASAPAEPLVMEELPAAVMAGTLQAWGIRAAPVLRTAVDTVEGSDHPDADELLRVTWLAGIEGYRDAAEAFARGDLDEGSRLAVAAKADWDAFSEEIDEIGERLRSYR
jgi:hypothetical protein